MFPGSLLLVNSLICWSTSFSSFLRKGLSKLNFLRFLPTWKMSLVYPHIQLAVWVISFKLLKALLYCLLLNHGDGEKYECCSDFWSFLSSSGSFHNHVFIPGALTFYNTCMFLFNSLGAWSKFSSITSLIISSSPFFALCSSWNSYKFDGLLGLIFWFYLFSPILNLFVLFCFLRDFFTLTFRLFYRNIYFYVLWTS